MLNFRSTAKFLGVFGAGVVTAGFFLSAPIEKPRLVQHAPDFQQAPNPADVGWVLVPPAIPYIQPLMTPPMTNMPAEQQAPPTAGLAEPERSGATTTGSASGDARQRTANQLDGNGSERETSAATQPAETNCNYSLCRRYYRSFDEATCTYQSYRGAREVCTR